jgi:hypothetical protein
MGSAVNPAPTIEASGTGRRHVASGPGWHPDPWLDGYHRYWDGNGWTTRIHRDGPPLETVPVPEPELAEPTPPGFWRRRRLVTSAVAAFVIGLLIAAVLVNAGKATRTSRTASPFPPQATTPPNVAPTTPPGPRDASASALSGLVVQQADVPATVRVQLLPAGTSVSQPTLDLCNGTFPSESLRTARLQVAAIDGRGSIALSTEAVLYRNAAATAQAFAELKSVSANCPASPVTSPVGEPPVITRFGAAPDAAWPQVATVERLAFDFVATDETGQTQHSVAVYLRRGRALMGLYFNQPDGAQSPVGGQTTIASITDLFATRLAQLPASVVNNP